MKQGPWILSAVVLVLLYLITRPHLDTTYMVVTSGKFYASEGSLAACQQMAAYYNQSQPSLPKSRWLLRARISGRPPIGTPPPTAKKVYECSSHVFLVWGSEEPGR